MKNYEEIMKSAGFAMKNGKLDSSAAYTKENYRLLLIQITAALDLWLEDIKNLLSEINAAAELS